MVSYSHLFQNFPQFIVIHIVKGLGIVNTAEIDVFLELSCFFHDPADVGNSIFVSSAFSKISLGGRSQDGGGVGWGEHFLPHKFIKRVFKRRVNSTKQLLNAGRGHQAPRKATQLFERREKKYSSIHQNIDTSFPNQETLTSHLYKPTHSEETPQ